MRNRILGLIGTVWGGGILYRAHQKGLTEGNDAYASGELVAVVFGGVMLLAGLYYLVKG